MPFILVPKNLCLENYDAFFNDPSPSSLSCLRLNEVLRLHGYCMLRRPNLLKGKVAEAINGIDCLLNPHRSTLNETLSTENPCPTVNEVNADLTALDWQEDFSVESFESISFLADSNTHANDIHGRGTREKQRKKRERKAKERIVFDAVHSTKPRSKNSVKRKCLSEF